METLLQKAQRLGIQPAGRNESPRVTQFRQEAQAKEAEFQRISSPTGQFKEFGKEIGEITGFSPTGRRIAAAIAPFTESEEDFANVVEELVGGVRGERKMGTLGKTLQGLGAPENLAEGVDIAIDLPLISLGLSRNIAKTISEQAGKTGVEALKLLDKPISEFLPEATRKILEKDLFKVPKEATGGLKELAETGKEKAVGGIKKLLEQPLPKQTETALKETKTEVFDRYVEQGKKASVSFKEKTPLETAGERAGEALDQIQRKLNNIGQSKQQVLDQAAVGNKPVGNIAVKFRQELQNTLKNKTSIEADQKVYNDILSEAQKLGDNPKAKEVDKFIDFVQDRIYSASRELTVPVSGDVEKILRPITGKLNESLKSQLPESYRNLNKQFSDLVGVRDELNTKLGKEGERGGSLMKRVFSPSDARTKELFAEVLKETGIDLTDEATIARFVMETMGDARQKSLLEELKLPKMSSGGILEFLARMIRERFNRPEEVLKRARELTTL